MQILDSVMQHFVDQPDMPMDYLITETCRKYCDSILRSQFRSIASENPEVKKAYDLVKQTFLYPENNVLADLLEEAILLKRIDSLL